MDRRKFLGATAGGAAMAMAGAGRAGAGKPNVIIFLCDDLGYGDVSCYGSAAIKTPNVDRLATEGMRLTSFFASAPVCSPSRAGLITGRYPIRTGTTDVYFPMRHPLGPAINYSSRSGAGLNLKEITLAQALKTAGYATCCIGKWHLGDLKPYRPHHRGFDHYLGLLYSNDMTPLPLFRDDEIVERAPVDQDYLTRKYTDEALAWLGQNKDRPFFLYFPYTSPHEPIHASPEFQGRSAAGLYGDCVEEIDASVGEVLAFLDREGLAENTFVFFTSDNGPWYEGSSGPLRGRKYQTFEGGMRVPGLARLPGVIPAGKVSPEMSMNFDLFATACALAGAPLPDDRIMDGANILPLLQGGPSPHERLFFYKSNNLQAVRQGQWKYHRRHFDYNAAYAVVPKGPFLFNLADDPDEAYNVATLYPDKAAELEAAMRDWERGLVKGVKRK
jgi:arylsulfatase A